MKTGLIFHFGISSAKRSTNLEVANCDFKKLKKLEITICDIKF